MLRTKDRFSTNSDLDDNVQVEKHTKVIFYRLLQMNIKKELFDRKFKNDEAYQLISKKYVTLNEDKKNINNNILTIVLAELIPVMKDSDSMFRKMSQGCMYGGSYYKRLKVSEPDEFDINLIMKLPIDYRNLKIVTENCNPGYVKIKVTDKRHLNKSDSDIWSALLDDDLYLDQNKFRNRMQSVLVKSLNRYTQNGCEEFVIKLAGNSFTINYSQSNPAFTLLIRRGDGVKLDVDLVPCLMFHDKELPGFTPHTKNTWITIAKPLRSEEIQSPNLLWRVGFYKDEKKMVMGNIKPVIRLMKRFRDVQCWPDIKSYYIETIFLHELGNEEFKKQYNHASRTSVFIYMLKRLMKMLRSGVILNYWHRNHNLLEKISEARLQCITRQLESIVNNIENNVENNQFVMLEYFESK